MIESNVYLDFLGKIFGNEKPLAKLLRTDLGYYLYDTETNKVLCCRKEVYDLIHDLFLKPVNSSAGDFVSKYDETGFLSDAKEIVEAINIEIKMNCREYPHLYECLLEVQK